MGFLDVSVKAGENPLPQMRSETGQVVGAGRRAYVLESHSACDSVGETDAKGRSVAAYLAVFPLRTYRNTPVDGAWTTFGDVTPLGTVGPHVPHRQCTHSYLSNRLGH